MNCIRLTLSVGPEEVELQKTTRLKMRCPSPNPEEIAGRAGTWIEVRDADGEVLYQRSTEAPAFESSIEVPTGTADRPFDRSNANKGHSLFHAVVPDLEAARTFHILQRDPSQDPDAKPQERARIDLRKVQDKD